jgi:hypothetical protein
MTPHNVKRAASQFLEARRSRQWLTALPEAGRSSAIGEAYAIQRLALGRSPDCEPRVRNLDRRENGVDSTSYLFNRPVAGRN